MDNIIKLSQCQKAADNSTFQQVIRQEVLPKYEHQGSVEQQYEEKKDVTESLNDIIFKQLFL